MAVHKRKEIKPPADEKVMVGKEEKPKEEVVVTDVVTETIEVIEQVTPQAAKSAKPAESIPVADPLTNFKEKMNEEESLPSDMPPKKNYMWPILFIFIITLLMLSGVFVYKNNTKSEKINVVTLSPTPTITPEPTKTIDLTQYKIKILNGSKVNGEAGRQKESLSAEGFAISSIGNADNSDYTNTIIKTKKEVDKDFLDKLKTVLESSFTVKEEELSEDASIPVIIILGKKI